MTLALVFNHDSLPCQNIETAQEFATQFIKLALACRRRFGFELILVDTAVDQSWFGIELASGYYWREWFEWAKRQSELRDLVTAFRSLQTRQPMLLPKDAEQMEYTVEVGLAGCNEGLKTLQAVHWYQTFLLSFPSFAPWGQTLVDVWITELRVDDETLVRHEAQIRNLFDDTSLTTHRYDLQALRDQRLQAGRDIWENRATFFPSLYLLDNLGSQLLQWSHRADVLNKAKEALQAMNEFVMRWHAGEFTDYRHEYLQTCGLSAEISGESASVANDARKREQREFWLPTGKKAYCEYHVKLPDGFRLHFYPCGVAKTIYVAYLGSHLRL